MTAEVFIEAYTLETVNWPIAVLLPPQALVRPREPHPNQHEPERAAEDYLFKLLLIGDSGG